MRTRKAEYPRPNDRLGRNLRLAFWSASHPRGEARPRQVCETRSAEGKGLARSHRDAGPHDRLRFPSYWALHGKAKSDRLAVQDAPTRTDESVRLPSDQDPFL